MSEVNLGNCSCCAGSGLGTKHEGKIGNSCESQSTSSIGKNSDVAGGEEDSGGEVESRYRGGGGGGALDAMEALEEVLPIRRGISQFYNGKSKSFASLAHASSIQDLAKLENAYTRRRRNLLASSLIWDKNRFTSGSLKSIGGGISKKRQTNLSRTNLAFAVAMAATSSEAKLEADINLVSHTKPLMSISSHLHGDVLTLRSFSMADLQFASATTSIGRPSTRSAFGG